MYLLRRWCFYLGGNIFLCESFLSMKHEFSLPCLSFFVILVNLAPRHPRKDMLKKRDIYLGCCLVLLHASSVASFDAKASLETNADSLGKYIKEASDEFSKRLPPAFLSPGSDVTTLPFNLPTAAYSVARLSTIDNNQVRVWVGSAEELAQKHESPTDREAILKCATNLKHRLQLQSAPLKPLEARGSKILFDARSLQDDTKLRGIGRFSLAALRGVKRAAPAADIVLLIDPAKQQPSEARHFATVYNISTDEVRNYRAFIQPSPFGIDESMAALPLLHSNATKIAIFYDFIPNEYPSFYLADPARRTFYGVQVASLRLYNGVVCISHTACDEVSRVLQKGEIVSFSVSWPENLLSERIVHAHVARVSSHLGAKRTIIIASGNENSEDPRKNTFAALAAVGAATQEEKERSVVIMGLHGLDAKVSQMAAQLKFREGEVINAGRISEAEKKSLLIRSSLMVVPSFAEGLSLPVIEAVTHGVPVVASRIAAHKELVGTADYLFDPYDIKSITEAVLKHRRNSQTSKKQRRRLFQHKHNTIERSLQTVLERKQGRPV
jgi:glycosyltransferase involved in cell wall biosynthesis